MTTRQEHFDATFGNFDQVLGELTQKGGASHAARLFRLEPWTDTQVIQFLELAAHGSSGVHRIRLEELIAAMKEKRDLLWPRELLRHPLFMQMIAELAAGGHAGARGAAELIGAWAMRKIARDVSVPRLTPVEIIDRSSFVDRMMLAMERTAGQMIIPKGEGYELSESLDSEQVVRIVSSAFAASAIDIAAVTGTSLLVPVTERRAASVPMKFSHRAFQEFFTARHARRVGLDTSGFPEPVQRLLSEMKR